MVSGDSTSSGVSIQDRTENAENEVLLLFGHGRAFLWLGQYGERCGFPLLPWLLCLFRLQDSETLGPHEERRPGSLCLDRPNLLNHRIKRDAGLRFNSNVRWELLSRFGVGNHGIVGLIARGVRSRAPILFFRHLLVRMSLV